MRTVSELVKYVQTFYTLGGKPDSQVLVDDGERLYRVVAGIYYDDAYDALIIDCADGRVEELKEPRRIPRA